MTELSLTGQTVSASQIQTRIVTLKSLMDQRKPIWDKISTEKKRAWILSNKDPIMSLSWDIYRYLENNFFYEEDING